MKAEIVAAEPVPPPPREVVIRMTMREAELLRLLIGHTGGGVTKSTGAFIPNFLSFPATECRELRAELVDKLYNALVQAGVRHI